MTNLQPIIDDLLHLQDKLAQLPFPHPWDNHVAKNSVARIDALVSDLRVVACRMREDQPRVTYDPATDQAVPVETKPEPAPVTEALMRAAQVGWVAVTARGGEGRVCFVRKDKAGFCAVFPDGMACTYDAKDCGRYGDSQYYDIVSLSPPDVVAELDEVVL